MFIAQAFKPDNKYWKYLVGSVIIIVASFIGQLPLGIGMAFKHMSTGEPMPLTQEGMMRYLDLNLTLFLLLLSFVAAFIALYFVVTRFHGQKFKEVITSRPKVDWGRIMFAFSIWAVFSVITTFMAYYSEPDQFILQFNPKKFAILAVIAIALIPVQTSVEEIVFRGYLMQGFGRLGLNRWFPLLMTSLIFGGMHLANPEVTKMGYIISIYYIGTGLFFGIMTLMDEGTELAIGFHAANNLMTALLVTADWTAFQTYSVFKDVSEPSAGFDVLLPVLIIYPIILFIFSRRYKWHSWKEKLTGKLYLPHTDYINQTPQSHE